jgi:transcriptional regulator with XRE-family HTH domain
MTTIRQTIRALREAKGWSHEDLVRAVSTAEGLAKTLSWQTVQQWERADGTAPSAGFLAPSQQVFLASLVFLA